MANGAAALIIVYDGDENGNHHSAVKGCGEDVATAICRAIINSPALLPVVRLAADFAENKLNIKKN